MIDPFDAALSDFVDSLPEEHQSAKQLLDEAAPFSGHGDLPELAELATMLRAVPPYEARVEWMAATKARLMTAPVLPPEKRGLTWLGTMFLPLTQISFPSLPKLTLPSPILARAVVAMALILTLGSMATSGSIGRSPLLQVTSQQGPMAEAQQAIAVIEQQLSLSGSDSAPRDIVLLSKQLQLADDAIAQVPPAEQPRLRAQLQGSVRAVRFDGTLEGINGTTLQIDGVAVQADPAVVRAVHVGQRVSLQVAATDTGKLQAVTVSPASPSTTDNPPNSLSLDGSTRGASSSSSTVGPTGQPSTSTSASTVQTSTTSTSTSGVGQSTGASVTAGQTSGSAKIQEKDLDSKGKSPSEPSGASSSNGSSLPANTSEVSSNQSSANDKSTSTSASSSSGASTGSSQQTPAPASTSSGTGQSQSSAHVLAVRDVTPGLTSGQGSASSSSQGSSRTNSGSGAAKGGANPSAGKGDAGKGTPVSSNSPAKSEDAGKKK